MRIITLTPAEAALEISPTKPPSTSTLSRWRQEGVGPAYLKIGKAVRYSPEAIQAYLNDCVVTPTSKSAADCDEQQFGAGA